MDSATQVLHITDAALVDRLRAGDETAFQQLVRAHHQTMLRVARAHVPTDAVAEEVVQEAWLGVLSGLDRFEGRASLKTWIFRILVNRAITRGAQERRAVAFSALDDDGEPDLDGFVPGNGRWSSVPRAFVVPEDEVVAQQLRQRIAACIDTLPPRQRAAIVLRDVEGWSAAEVCDALELSDANQRVLLHRARAKVRVALERALQEV